MFIRVKKRGSKKYYYLVRATREDGKKKNIERYIGNKKPTDDEIGELSSDFQRTGNLLNSKKDMLAKVRAIFEKRMKTATADEIKEIEGYILTRYTYESSRIEGSSLTYKDTKLLLEEGITPSNKPLIDIKETENHKKAFEFLKENLKEPLTERFILKLHSILKDGVTEDAGSFRDRQVVAGDLVPIKANLIDAEMKKIIKEFKNSKNHIIEKATFFHGDFERIHPFFDGNGRVGRLILNYMLLKERYPPVNIQHKNRRRYYNALRKADDGDYYFLLKYILSELENAVKYYR